MKRKLTLASLICLVCAALTAFYFHQRYTTNYDLQTGDIVFQEGFGNQAIAVKAATDSRWSHVGIVFKKNEKTYVLEAVQPVKITSLKEFISRDPKSFYALRLKDKQALNKQALTKGKEYGSQQLGKNYDLKFCWDNQKIYCSELVWKIYQHATGIELCSPRQGKEYNLNHPSVADLIKKRYGNQTEGLLDEPIVAPSDLARSPLLTEVPRQ